VKLSPENALGEGNLPTVLIVDDEAAVRDVLCRALRLAGFNVHEAADGPSALAFLYSNDCDVLLTDQQMPGLKGNDLLRIAREHFPDLGVLLITAITDVERAVTYLKDGADDYITKPFMVADVVVRVHQTLEAARQRTKERRLREVQAAQWSEQVISEVSRMREQFLQSLFVLCETAEAQDEYRKGHTARLIEKVDPLVELLYPNDEMLAAQLLIAARLHEVARLGNPGERFHKPHPLTPSGWEMLRQEALGYQHILQPLLEDEGILNILLYHHESWDGKGYPQGLQGEQIPRGARLLAVIDAFVAMTSPRPYRPALSPQKAVSLLQIRAGKQWEEEAVTGLVSLIESESL
jgi:putative two-component system response regulator